MRFFVRTNWLFRSTRVPAIATICAGFWLAFILAACQPLLSASVPAAPIPPAATPSPVPQIEYHTQTLPQSVMHWVKVPAGDVLQDGTERFEIIPQVAEQLTPIETFAAQSGAAVVINAGYFDPVNQQTTSFITIAGQLVADPRQNQRLMENPNLTTYLDRILNRSELRRYDCGQTPTTVRMQITLHQTAPPTHCQVRDGLGAGPQLLPELTLETEGFVDRATGRDAIGSNRPNARSAVGITATGDVILAIATQTSPTSGMSLPEMASFLRSLGAVQAINLDGGSSTSLFVNGQTIYGKVNAAGERVKRPVKSVLLVRSLE